MDNSLNMKCPGSCDRKKSITNCFLELAGKREVQDITLVEICQRQGISKTTFYKYFKDKYEVIDSIAEDLFCIFTEDEPPLSRETFKKKLKDVMTKWWEERTALESIFRYGNQNSIYERLFQISEQYTELCLHGENMSPEIRELSRGYAYARAGLLKEWLSKKEFFADDSHAERLMLLCPAPLSKLYKWI